MRMVTQGMVVLEGARFGSAAQGWFSAQAQCPNCGEERQVTVPIWDVGETHTQHVNCNAGHEWDVRARIVA